MNTPEHRYVGPLMHDRIIGALETVLPARRDAAGSRTGTWTGNDTRSPFLDVTRKTGRIAAFRSTRRSPGARPQAPRMLGPNAFVFGSPAGEFLANFKTAWESLLPDRQRPRHEARETRCSRRSRQAAGDRPALARPAS